MGILFWIACLTSLHGPAAAGTFSFGDLGAVLQEFVKQEGMVSYRGLKANPQRLQDFLQELAQVHPEDYQGWPASQQIAFWINAYNALTLKAIIDHYPIKASWFRSLKFPKNSIRQIPGVWTKLRFPVMGRQMTLDDIEHATLRQQFNEPRIHAALVCAAMGCPPLRNEPYLGEKLDQQLNDQTRRFLANPQKFRIDRDQGKVYLSPIFKWFGQDFVKTYGTTAKFSSFSPKERAVLNFIQAYLSKEDRDYLLTGKYSISYLKYDWSLNEQKE
jgi:hypothetical protein